MGRVDDVWREGLDPVINGTRVDDAATFGEPRDHIRIAHVIPHRVAHGKGNQIVGKGVA
jgi:hypothetical protein